MNSFVQKHIGPDVYSSLGEAILGLYQKGKISLQDRELIVHLNVRDDKHLMASWWAYSVIQDEDDLADSFRTLCEAKRSKDGPNSVATKDTATTFQLGQENIKPMVHGNNEPAQQPYISNRSSDNIVESDPEEKVDSGGSN